MAKIRIPTPQLRKLVQEARKEPKLIDNWPDFLKECVRWRLPVNKLLEFFKLNRALQKKIKADAEERDSVATPFKPRMMSHAVWAEITAAQLDDPMPEAWEAEPVVVTPGDPTADPPVPPVTRPRKWGEFFIVIERPGGRYFCPCSDGVEYFDIQKVDALESAGVTMVDIEDIPEAPSEV